MAKGARSKRRKRNNTVKREKVAKFENEKLEVLSNKLRKIIEGESGEMDVENDLPKLESDNIDSLAKVIIENNEKPLMDIELGSPKIRSVSNINNARKSRSRATR